MGDGKLVQFPLQELLILNLFLLKIGWEMRESV
jgi:hypothetical protein